MDAWYRFRILNSNFRQHYQDIRFLTPDNNPIQYILIGQDSSLMKTPVWNLTTFSLASAERVDLLIKFESSVLDQGDKVNLTFTSDGNVTLIPIEIDVVEQNSTILNYNPPTALDVPFKNLTDNDVTVDKKRMRPLFRKAGVFSVNAHLHFHDGESENPQIGTTEDWFMVNTLTNSHPFHVHLINYQIVKDYILKSFSTTANNTCTYYEIDFYLRYANKTQCFTPSIQKKIDDGLTQELFEAMCDYIQGDAMDKERMMACFGEFANQHDFDTNNISGIDVEQLADSSFKYNKTKSSCSLSGYKYLCDNVTEQIPTYNRGWKEVGYVQPHHALTLRIRWTRTGYNSTVDDEYFHVPERELIEFPGYVYHCHFLPHEDNEMMRPIMMQPSSGKDTLNRYPWSELYKTINNRIGCGTARKDRGNDLRRI